MSEKPKRIILEVKQHNNCPLYLKGNRMVLAPPEVLRNSSDRICALAITKLLPTVLRRLSEMGSPDFQPPIVECPGCSGGSAHFVIKPFSGTGDTVRAKTPRRDTMVTERPPPFLSSLPSEVVELVLGKCEVRRFNEPTVIVEEGSDGDYLYFVGKGGADVIKISDGKEKVIWNLQKGDCFGEMSVLTGQPSSATIRTTAEDTAILSLPKETLDDLVATTPVLAKQISILLSQRLRVTNEDLLLAKDNTLAGELSSRIQLGNVIQNLNQSALSGTLILSKPDDEVEGMITFSEGEIADASFAELSGEDAVYKMMAWREGSYRFNDDEDSKRRTRRISRNTTMLLMEGMRRMDEAGR